MSTPNATRTSRARAQRIANDPAGFNGLPFPAAQLGMPEPTDVRYDARAGHPVGSYEAGNAGMSVPPQRQTYPQGEYQEPKMKPPRNDKLAERAPFELGPLR